MSSSSKNVRTIETARQAKELLHNRQLKVIYPTPAQGKMATASVRVRNRRAIDDGVLSFPSYQTGVLSVTAKSNSEDRLVVLFGRHGVRINRQPVEIVTDGRRVKIFPIRYDVLSEGGLRGENDIRLPKVRKAVRREPILVLVIEGYANRPRHQGKPRHGKPSNRSGNRRPRRRGGRGRNRK
ncbi:hypothetical protein ACFL26_02555 [Patescibacteria group bacterium]